MRLPLRVHAGVAYAFRSQRNLKIQVILGLAAVAARISPWASAASIGSPSCSASSSCPWRRW
ncbi:MAG: hypothetical protein ACLTDR_07060 [Adlercreutzia equolifaciens]